VDAEVVGKRKECVNYTGKEEDMWPVRIMGRAEGYSLSKTMGPFLGQQWGMLNVQGVMVVVVMLMFLQLPRLQSTSNTTTITTTTTTTTTTTNNNNNNNNTSHTIFISTIQEFFRSSFTGLRKIMKSD
jgi:uncharacterized membrane protein YfcA